MTPKKKFWLVVISITTLIVLNKGDHGPFSDRAAGVIPLILTIVAMLVLISIYLSNIVKTAIELELGKQDEENKKRAKEGLERFLNAMRPMSGMAMREEGVAAPAEAYEDSGRAIVQLILDHATVSRVKVIALLKNIGEADVMARAVDSYLYLNDNDNADTVIAIINRKTKQVIKEVDM